MLTPKVKSPLILNLWTLSSYPPGAAGTEFERVGEPEDNTVRAARREL
jgi:hypothetical protein